MVYWKCHDNSSCMSQQLIRNVSWKIYNYVCNFRYVQGSAKRWFSGCVNVAGKARQKW